MKKILLFLLILFIPLLVSAESGKKSAVYFYADWCPHCQKVNAYFTEQGFYEKYDIQKLNFDESENKILLQKIFVEKGLESKQVGIPAIIIDDKLITGDQDIISSFQKNIENSKGTTVQFIEQVKSGKKSGEVPMVALISAALVDAINPCAFAVLILLIATVINAKGKNQALYSGIMFSLAVFVSYFLMGLGVYKAITIFNLPFYISLVVAIISILIGLANLKDAFWYGKIFVMEVPFSWRPKMQSIIKHVTNPLGAAGAGVLVSLFLLPCSSGPYVVILGLMAERVDLTKTISLLALYNLIFVLPMIGITLAMYFFNLRGKKLEEWRQKNLRLLHAVAGTIMLLLGMYLIYLRS
jgi:cytochrome c biogenesis protein CcdA/glutaredoxin-related protein